MMRIRNEARWIERVVRSMAPVCSHIYIMDDHSTDDTVALCGRVPNVTVYGSPFDGLDETRDKNWLLSKIEGAGADWILHIDGDEELEPGSAELIRELCANRNAADAYRFQVLYLWDRPDQIRTDRWYRDYRRPSLFQLHPGARFKSAAGAGFHCGNVPEPRSMGDCGVRLIHWGYMNRDDRIAKFHWYNADDKQPVPWNEDGYRHMVIGDLFPANSVFMHAGPLELREYKR